VSTRATPSLRIARLVITNFRTFRDPTEIALSSNGAADAMPVFHGTNGTGKSNALAAIDLFFRIASAWLSHPASDLGLPWYFRDQRSGLLLDHRSWPPGSRGPQRIEIHFDDTSVHPLRASLIPSGNNVAIKLERGTSPERWEALMNDGPKRSVDQEIPALQNALETPLGPGSKPFFLLDARRRDYRSIGEGETRDATTSPLSAAMADRLLALATSLDPDETERWRVFVALVHRFKTLAGRELSVLRIPIPGEPSVTDLRFEVRGKQILRLSELSSGEQQVVAVAAAVLTSRAALVAIEEPEMSLHPENQALVRDVLLEQVRSGVVDQIFLESHVPIFDGPEVLRFSRSADGDTSVTRQRARPDNERLRASRARAVPRSSG
jgi:hypothetical protein